MRHRVLSSRIMYRIFSLLLVCLFFNSNAFGQSRDQTANGLEIKGAFTQDCAMDLIYGSFDYSQMLSRWTPKQTRNYPNAWPDTIDVWPLFDITYVESGVPKYLLVTAALPTESFDGEFSCHACAPMIGLALFAKDGDGWRVEASDLQFGYYGAFGKPASISLQPVGPTRYGVLIRSSFEQGGVVDDSITIIVSKNGRFLNTLDRQMAESWDDDGCSGRVTVERKESCIAYDGDVEMAPNPSSEYYDLLLTKRVYRSFSKKNPIGTTVTRYRFDGSKYVPEKAPGSNTSHPPN